MLLKINSRKTNTYDNSICLVNRDVSSGIEEEEEEKDKREIHLIISNQRTPSEKIK